MFTEMIIQESHGIAVFDYSAVYVVVFRDWCTVGGQPRVAAVAKTWDEGSFPSPVNNTSL